VPGPTLKEIYPYLVPHSLVEGCLLCAGLNLDKNAVGDCQVLLQLIQAYLQDQRPPNTLYVVYTSVEDPYFLI